MHRQDNHIRLALLTTLTILAVLLARPCLGAQPATLAVETPEILQLHTEQSLILSTAQNITRVSVASPELAEVMVISPTQIYITGKSTGSTTLTVWGKSDAILAVYNVVVSPDLMVLKQLMHTVLPHEPNIQVMATGEKIALSGSVSSSASLATALSLADAAAPDNVVNLLSVGGVHQVMVEVRIAEMNRSVTKRLGFNFQFGAGTSMVYSFLNNLTEVGDTLAETVVNDNIGMIFSGGAFGGTLLGFIDALKSQGLVKILAEPTLICLSGETANFLAGGEIPVPVPSGLGTLAIEYKPFGVWLEIKPTVLSDGKISMAVNPEVSELDYDRGVNIESIVVPALSTRRATTTIELGDGQSFAIAGLLKDNLRETSQKFPLLGDVPILGSLFRSQEYLKEQTELVIIVTPRLVKPIDGATATLPTDGFQEPNDFEFYMLGLIDSAQTLSPSQAQNQSQEPLQAPSTGFDGDFGHTMPN